jgi:hypothetical protein
MMGKGGSEYVIEGKVIAHLPRRGETVDFGPQAMQIGVAT